MKKLVIVFTVLVSVIFAVEPDLIMYEQYLVTPEIMEYYRQSDSSFHEGADQLLDMDLYNSSHLGLAFLEVGYAGMDVDTFAMNMFGQLMAFDTTLYSLFSSTIPLIYPYVYTLDSLVNDSAWNANFGPEAYLEFVANVAEFLESEDLVEIQNAIQDFENTMDQVKEDTRWLIWNQVESTSMSADTILYHFNQVMDNDAEFDFVLHLIGEEGIYNPELGYEVYVPDTTEFVFNRTFMNRLESFVNDISSGVNLLGDGIDQMHDISMGMEITPTYIDMFIDAVASIQNANDTLKVMIKEQPLSALQLGTNGIEDADSVLAAADAMLKGKTYVIDETENFIIRPVGILENLPYGLIDVFLAMYYESDITNYTFGNIFPNGVPGIERLAYDMVINYEVSEIDLLKYFAKKYSEYELILATNPDDTEAHAGIAVIELTALMHKAGTDFAKFQMFMEEGRIDSVYNIVSKLSAYNDQMFSIIDHLSYLAYSYNGEVFTLLFSDGEYTFITLPPVPGYDDLPVEGDDLTPLYITPELARMFIGAYEAVNMIVQNVAYAVGEVMAQANNYVVLDLNPAVLDFSQAQTPLDYVLVLENSNPNFLSLTETGKAQLIELGKDIKEVVIEANTVMDTVMYWAPEYLAYADAFGLDSLEMMYNLYMIDYLVDMVYYDFTQGGTYSMFGDLAVDLSIWFEVPPESILAMWKDYLTGTDDTFGGLFPEGLNVAIDESGEIIEAESFKLMPAYPNPFNPVTNIRFDIPEKSDVSIMIFNIRGELVEELVSQRNVYGRMNISWDAGQYSSGVYFCVMQAGSFRAVQKLTLLK